jgi:uncharacterized membrane protein YccC
MSVLVAAWNSVCAWCKAHRVELRLCLRATASAVLALAVAHLLDLPLVLWTVLTAVILTQISVGRSVKATLDYLTSTLGGAVYAGAIGAIVPHAGEPALLAALALAVAPPAFIAATNPRFSAAPVTAIMVFFGPTITHAGPIASAFERVAEVAVGALVGLLVSFVVFPSRGTERVLEAATGMLALIAQALPELIAGLMRGRDEDAIRALQDRLGDAFARLNTIAPEVRHERITRLAAGADPAPLLRTLLRLRHDLVMIGRAAVALLPQPLQARLSEPLNRVGASAAEYLRASADALKHRRGPASLDGFEAALHAYAQEVGAVRYEGLTRDLPTEAVEHFYALGFVLERLHRNFIDLARCVAEFFPSPRYFSK